MSEGDAFEPGYDSLERGLKQQAKADGDLYVPNIRPSGPVEVVFVAMEPFLRFAHDPVKHIRRGFRGFTYSVEDFILHYAARRFMNAGREKYHITDVSKGAMPVDVAKQDRKERFKRWLPLLEEELSLVGPDARIYPIGTDVCRFLKGNAFVNLEPHILHYGRQAAGKRAELIREWKREREFESFAREIDVEDICEVAAEVLDLESDSGMDPSLREETLARIGQSDLTTPRKRLLFVYKTQMTRGRPPCNC